MNDPLCAKCGHAESMHNELYPIANSCDCGCNEFVDPNTPGVFIQCNIRNARYICVLARNHQGDHKTAETILREFAQKCLDIAVSPTEGATIEEASEALLEYVVSWPHGKDGILKV